MSSPLARLRAILPVGIVAAGGPVSDLQEPLPAEEEAALARARAGRRADFTAGRTAARRTLAGLGLPASPLPRDPRGPAVWPAGVTGSISHGAGWALAAAARKSAFAGIGIDIEAALSFVPLEEIALPDEIDALGRLDPVVLFSAKESAYKAQFHLTGRLLGFHDLQVTLADGDFTATLLRDTPPLGAGSRISGGWSLVGDTVVTMAVVSH